MTDITKVDGLFGAGAKRTEAGTSEALWRAEDAARCLQLSISIIHKGRIGQGACATLPFLRLGRAIRYIPAAVREWRDRQTTTGAAEAAKSGGKA